MNGSEQHRIDPADSFHSYRVGSAAAALPAVKIVHLSDCHFVTRPILRRFHSLYKGLRAHDEETREALTNQVQQLKPDLLFATGDHTTWGDETSLRAAHHFLLSLGSSVGLEKGRIFWVPGNHDILLDYYLYLGARFFRRRYEAVFGENQTVRVIEVSGYKLAVFSFDSTLDRSKEWSPLWPLVGSRGRIARRTFNDFNRCLCNTAELEGCFKIAQLHHHPLPIPYKDGDEVGLELTTMTNGGTFIAYMQESRVNLVLHGHEHHPYGCRYCYDPRKPDIVIVAAGTACQGESQKNSFNYIELVPDVSIAVRQYTYSSTGFRLDRESTKVF